ncbi:hypothetical protein VTN96DRAFT_3582 [Rasamsonia emersonii]
MGRVGSERDALTAAEPRISTNDRVESGFVGEGGVTFSSNVAISPYPSRSGMPYNVLQVPSGLLRSL